VKGADRRLFAARMVRLFGQLIRVTAGPGRLVFISSRPPLTHAAQRHSPTPPAGENSLPPLATGSSDNRYLLVATDCTCTTCRYLHLSFILKLLLHEDITTDIFVEMATACTSCTTCLHLHLSFILKVLLHEGITISQPISLGTEHPCI
jgi:hypothetical protein